MDSITVSGNTEYVLRKRDDGVAPDFDLVDAFSNFSKDLKKVWKDLDVGESVRVRYSIEILDDQW